MRCNKANEWDVRNRKLPFLSVDVCAIAFTVIKNDLSDFD